MESNRFYHYLFKFGLLGVGLILLVVPITSYITPELVTINGETGQTDTYTTLIFGLLSLLMILVFIAIKKKFAIVELGNQTVKIKHGGQERLVNWQDIEHVQQIKFVMPPLYKLKTKDRNQVVWFNTEPEFVSVNGFTTDTSEMGELIKKKKRELGV